MVYIRSHVVLSVVLPVCVLRSHLPPMPFSSNWRLLRRLSIYCLVNPFILFYLQKWIKPHTTYGKPRYFDMTESFLFRVRLYVIQPSHYSKSPQRDFQYSTFIANYAEKAFIQMHSLWLCSSWRSFLISHWSFSWRWKQRCVQRTQTNIPQTHTGQWAWPGLLLNLYEAVMTAASKGSIVLELARVSPRVARAASPPDLNILRFLVTGLKPWTRLLCLTYWMCF